MLQDSVRHYVPGQELHDAACMVTLRDSLHFVEASVERFEMTPPGQPMRSFLTIKLIEPAEAARVQWDVRQRNEFGSLLPDYAPLVLAVTDSVGGFWRGRVLFWLQFADSVQREAAMTRASASGRVDGASALLKRTAMVAWGRGKIASLNGQAWVDWMNDRCEPPVFTGDSANLLAEGQYDQQQTLNDSQLRELLGAVRHWIRHHQARPG
jgi:hypothetical protein